MKIRKCAFTLMEIMIVIFLIGIIGGVISYNMRGSLDRGRAFKTEQAMRQIKDIFELELANGNYSADQIVSESSLRENIIKASGLAKEAKGLLKDGWNQPFAFAIDQRTRDRILVISDKYDDYKKKQKKTLGAHAPADEEPSEE